MAPFPKTQIQISRLDISNLFICPNKAVLVISLCTGICILHYRGDIEMKF